MRVCRINFSLHLQFIPDRSFLVCVCAQIVTNGLLQSVEHRAVTNSSAARLSVVTVMLPDMDCRIEPAPALVKEEQEAKFRPFLFREFNEAYAAAAANREDVLHRFRIHPAHSELTKPLTAGD